MLSPARMVGGSRPRPFSAAAAPLCSRRFGTAACRGRQAGGGGAEVIGLQRRACRSHLGANDVPESPTRAALLAAASRQAPTAKSLLDSTLAAAGAGEACATSSSHHHSRRELLLAAAPVLLLLADSAGVVVPRAALAARGTPDGYRVYLDRLDGYEFVYPDDWTRVTSSGSDIFLRNPFNVDENLFVDISSPSSSRFEDVQSALGTPQQAAQSMLDRYLRKEFQSTRLGIKRYGEVVGARSRKGDDGRRYYDLEFRMVSYASRDPYVATRVEVLGSFNIEWDRTLVTTVGVANRRLYELRLQTATDTYEEGREQLDMVRNSFRCSELAA